MAAILITLAKFQEGYESGAVFDVFSVTVNSEKRLYGRCGEQITNLKPYKVVYCVVP